jgi:hypothetical protein
LSGEEPRATLALMRSGSRPGARVLSRRHVIMGAAALPASLLGGCKSDVAPPPPRARLDTRSVVHLIDAAPSRDGASVSLRRTIGSGALPMLDPFLLLDEIKSDEPTDYAGGFPDHPHRGFETVTVMLEGAMEHRDSVGNHGRLVAGSVQWMTAGRGIIHSEMPKQQRGLMWGLQLWVNLPRAHKMTKPRYQDIAPTLIPEISDGGSPSRVIAGARGRERGPVRDIAVTPTLLDVRIPPGARFEHELPHDDAAFALVLDGSVVLGAASAPASSGQLAVFGPGAVVVAKSVSGARLLIGAGRKLNEPVARRGPFVMNTREELVQAFEDYRSGRLTAG